ncbi:unnamed protein product [Discosporangium mesarthrocarpum]
MSGRLIILPHKSWHVGKRENIEKVKRDERLAAEEEDVARQRAREVHQEKNVEVLREKRYISAATHPRDGGGGGGLVHKRTKESRINRDDEAPGGTDQGWGTRMQHVNFFSNEEREAGKRLGKNADHEREKRERDLAEQRKTGLAPVALGDGAAELKAPGSKPWYQEGGQSATLLARAVRLGREVMGEEAKEVIKRDMGRKDRADPLASLFRPSTGASPGDTRVWENSLPAGNKGRISGVEIEKPRGALGGEVEGASAQTSPHRERKRRREGKVERESHFNKSRERKKHKKKKDRKRRKKYEQDNSDRRSNSPCSSSPRRHHKSIDGYEKAEEPGVMEILRQKRMERERQERSRSLRFLAERQMAGQSIPHDSNSDRTRTYNSQFNPSLARQSRPGYLQ